jgi:GTP-dependent phosphoenolpyruvate carboxykinase
MLNLYDFPHADFYNQCKDFVRKNQKKCPHIFACNFFRNSYISLILAYDYAILAQKVIESET